MDRTERTFCSKILLFGEYSVIRGSMALASPYNAFEGRLVFPYRDGNSEFKQNIDMELKAFARHLRDNRDNWKSLFDFDSESFEFDVEQGLYFQSTIPAGFGVGSSAALTAAVFHRYGKTKKTDTDHLVEVFSRMESHFHGKSSGVDPLISYLEQSFLMTEGHNVKPVNIPDYQKGNGAIFLLNTGLQRRTGPLVNLFLEKLKQNDFLLRVDEVLTPITNECIKNFLEGNTATLYQNFRDLSFFQFKELVPMIPPIYARIWEEGLLSQKYFLKLCGAGGGGFLIGIARNFEEARKTLDGQQMRILYRLSF